MKLKNIDIKEKIRTVKLESLEIGGDSSFSFMSENNNSTAPVFALEIPYIIEKNTAKTLTEIYPKEFLKRFEMAESSLADVIGIKFNLSEDNLEAELKEAKAFLGDISSRSAKPLMLKGTNSSELNKVIIPELISVLKTPAIIASCDENTYETILPLVIEGNHIAVLSSPIDINIAKELNILSIDKKLDPNKILIDTDMGGLGYGLDYGYSIMERIKSAGFEGDTMLNMPLIAFAGEEVFKSKEAKAIIPDENWGNYDERAIMWEITTASAVISAGANLVVLCHPKSVEILKEIVF